MILSHRLRERLVLALLLLLTAATLSVGGTSFLHRVAGFQQAGVALRGSADGWVVEEVTSARSELTVGDVLMMIDGREVVGSADPIDGLRSGQSELLILRGGDLLQVGHTPARPDVDLPYLLLSLIAVVYLGIGLYTLLRGVDRQTALFHLWCLTSAALYLVSPRIPFSGSIDRAFYGVDQAVRLILPPLTLHFFLRFPRVLPSASRSLRLIVPLLYAPPVALLAYLSDQMWFGGRWFAGTPTVLSIRVTDRIELALLVIYIAAAVVCLFAQGLRLEPRREERQLLWIALGLTVGYLPFLALNVLPYSAGLVVPELLRSAGVAPLVLVPLSFAWAILRYRLWDIGVILRDLTTYGLTLLVGGAGFAVLNLLIERGLPQSFEAARNLTTVAGGLLVASLLIPAKQTIGATLERLQYRGALARRRALSRLGEELLLERDLEQLCRGLLFQLEEAYGLETCNLYLIQEDDFHPVRVEGRNRGLDLALQPDDIDAQVWTSDYYHLEGAGLPDLEIHAERELFARGYRTAFPLTVRNRRIGLLLVGDKAGNTALNSDDALLVRQLLNQAALAIENAQLIEHMRQQLREVVELKQFNEEIIESSPAGIAVLDEQRRILTGNVAFAALVGMDRGALRRRDFADVLPDLELPSSDSGLLETEYFDRNGRRRHLQISTGGLLGERSASMQVVVINDTTDLDEMERTLQEKERLAELGMMAAGVAHEVNTPLTGISSYAQMLLGSIEDGDPRRELLHKMERQTVRASRIVNRLLEFSRAARPTPELVSLVANAREAVELLDTRLERARVDVEWLFDERSSEDLLVRANGGEIQQVVTNLVVNATEALEELSDGGDRRITLRALERNGDAVLEVEDNGPGIDPRVIDRIFQPFTSTKTESGGTGLGLAITYQIVRRYDGSLEARNLEDGGCRFTLRFALANTPLPPSGGAGPSADDETNSNHPETVH